MESTILRALEIEPTSERITEDIKVLSRVLHITIDAEGSIAKDEFLHNDRRAGRADDNEELMHRPCRSERVATLKARNPLHPDADHAIDILRRGGTNLPTTILDKIVENFLRDEDLADEKGYNEGEVVALDEIEGPVDIEEGKLSNLP